MNPLESNSDSSLGAAAQESTVKSIKSTTQETGEEMKRAAQHLIERYFYQLVQGCGNVECTNEHCASNCKQAKISSNEAAVKAIELVKMKAKLCDSCPTKQRKKYKLASTASSAASVAPDQPDKPQEQSTTKDKQASEKVAAKVSFVTEEIITEKINILKESKSASPLVRLIGSVFSDWQALNRSFLKRKPLTKEEKSALSEDKDKDTDECDAASCSYSRQSSELDEPSELDLDALKRVYTALQSCEQPNIINALQNAIDSLASTVEMEARWNYDLKDKPEMLNFILIIMENPMLQSPEFLDLSLPRFCKAVASLPLAAQANLVNKYSKFSPENLKTKLDTLQQLVTYKAITGTFRNIQQMHVNDDSAITNATKFMRIIYYASILGGTLDVSSYKATPDEETDWRDMLGAVGPENKDRKVPVRDELEKALGIDVLTSTKPLIPFSEFYNEPLNEQLEVDHDFTHFKNHDPDKFSFLNFPFILLPATKNQGLFYDNRIRMFNERRMTVLHSLVQGDQFNPYLKLKVRRDHVVDDALVRLELIAMDNPGDLKKQLFVEFQGEQGVDEGGVSKEFFQLVIQEIFNPDIGMFVENEENKTYWFNTMSFESDRQFTLIGVVLGLAIYNNIILNVQFPMTLYRKLLGKRATFNDMLECKPVLYNSMKSLLEYEGNVEEDFMQTFSVGMSDVFGGSKRQKLKEDGDKIPLTNDNRQEFVDLYADFILNRSVSKQFQAFKRGFDMVTDESPLKIWFRPEEVELLVCGNKYFDFESLEGSTEYDGGYSNTTPVIKYFWEVVNAFSDEQKKQLLMFTTGSDRVPVGGLAKLRLIIAKNGPDSNRLPTAHTCFNVLLLPEYATREKLKDRLVKAITHAKGFGML
ncbi:ubiquitin-protein ligase E3A-like [Antedon mediterranea]|uniref:ubiquitin-protein ligase E3A-like n=1 Tax=Antedon mediterranea TaxID=105859 RepID=UPI003AF44E88